MNSAPNFESLTNPSKADLARLMRIGLPPAIADVVGYNFRGRNLQPSTKLLGTRKFKKGFYGDPAAGYAWGYYVPVQQNAKQAPRISTPSEELPKRYFFFKVLPSAAAEDPKYSDSLVVDYRKWPKYSPLNPVRYTVDYLVYPTARPRSSPREKLLGARLAASDSRILRARAPQPEQLPTIARSC